MSNTCSTEQAAEIALAVAHQNAMERGCSFLPHGCRLFHTEQGWESTVIRRQAAVADTLLSLEAALRDPETKVIFMPHDAMIAPADIEKICHRNGVVKTLFKEVVKEEIAS